MNQSIFFMPCGNSIQSLGNQTLPVGSTVALRGTRPTIVLHRRLNIRKAVLQPRRGAPVKLTLTMASPPPTTSRS